MGLDIGQALREGASRTTARNGLLLAAVFAGIALLSAILWNTVYLRALDAFLELLQATAPAEIGMSPQEYAQQLEAAENLESTLNQSPTLGIPLGVAAGGVLALAIVGEAALLVAVRIFANAEIESISRDRITDNLLLATLNGFVGKILVWGLIFLGTLLFVLPGIVLAVLFFFLRQEIAIKDKNFVQAMADSWRLTKGNRIEVFLVGSVLVIVSQLDVVTATLLDIVSTTAGLVGAAIVGGLVTAFAVAVATRAYVQIDEGVGDGAGEGESDEPAEDPYDAALGPEDLPR